MAEISKRKRILNVVLNVMIYALIGFILLMMIVSNFTKKSNEIVKFLGYSLAVIQTPSMATNGKFNPGDMVVIHSENPSNLQVGDIIVFYQYYDTCDQSLPKTKLTELNEIPQNSFPPLPDELKNNRRDKNDIMEDKNVLLIFHRIVAIYIDEYGERFFETQGDRNGGSDGCVRQDLVEGKYIETPKVLTAILQFISTPVGILLVVMLPIFILFVSQIVVFGKDVKKNLAVNNLLNGKIIIEDESLKNINLKKTLNLAEKAFLFDVSPLKNKKNVALAIWDKKIDYILKLYNQDRKKYWNYWLKSCPKKDRKSVILSYIQAHLVLFRHKSFEEAVREAKIIYKEKKKNGIIGERNSNTKSSRN